MSRLDAQFSQVFSGSKHFIELVLTPTRARFVVRRTRTGNLRPPAIIDQFEITRDAPKCFR